MIDKQCYIHTVPDFEIHKKNLISKIFKIPKNPYKMTPRGDTLSHTDWDLPEKMEREYKDYFINNIFQAYAKNFCNNFKNGSVKLTGLWFQVYGLNDSHEPHTHPGCHFTNVFFLQLPDKDLKTQIQLPGDEKLDINVTEGDILTFPAFYWHRSPINKSGKEKIIISFNIDII